MNGNNLFNFSAPNFDFTGTGAGTGNTGFMSSGQMQSNMNQAFSPQALYQQHNPGGGNPWFGAGSIPSQGQAAGGLRESLFGAEGSPGWLNGGLSVLNGLGNTWLGMQQYGLAKDSFNFNKQLASQNYENQAQLSNRSLEASLRRQAIMDDKDPDQAASQGMEKWGLDEKVGG